jgi:hypothetical protein
MAARQAEMAADLDWKMLQRILFCCVLTIPTGYMEGIFGVPVTNGVGGVGGRYWRNPCLLCGCYGAEGRCRNVAMWFYDTHTAWQFTRFRAVRLYSAWLAVLVHLVCVVTIA